MYILDTNVVSALRRPRAQEADVVEWVGRVNEAALYISAITLFELELGVRLKERRDARQGAVLRRWLEGRVLAAFRDRTMPIDGPVARVAAGLHVPDPRPERDALIAATAIEHGMAVVTRNTADFMPFDVPVIDPWQAASGS